MHKYENIIIKNKYFYLLHAGIKPYVCPICDKRFTQISSLAKHKQIHTPKDFTQQYCNPSLINDKLQAKDCALNKNEVTIHYFY